MVTHNPTLAGLVMPLFAFGSSARQPVAIMALHAIIATGVLLVRVRRRAPPP
jgi:hypothetical protein